MATNDQCKITKDTSARKNVEPSGMDTALEMDAILASHAAYIKVMKAGHEDQKQTLKRDYEASLASLNAQLTKERGAVAEMRKAAIQEALADATQEASKKITALLTEKGHLTMSLEEALEKNKATKKAADSQLARHQSQIVNLTTAHDRDVTALNRKLAVGPQSWTEISLCNRKRKTRTYVRRQSARFEDAVQELCKDIGKASGEITFSLKHGVIRDRRDTLTELEIKDGDEVWYTVD